MTAYLNAAFKTYRLPGASEYFAGGQTFQRGVTLALDPAALTAAQCAAIACDLNLTVAVSAGALQTQIQACIDAAARLDHHVNCTPYAGAAVNTALLGVDAANADLATARAALIAAHG